MRRRLLWLVLLSVATAAAVAYRIGKRSRRAAVDGGEWSSGETAGLAEARPDRTGTRGTGAPEEAPTEGPAMVVATMEATSGAAGTHYARNGSVTGGEPEPGTAGSEPPLRLAEPGSVGASRRRRPSPVTLGVLGAIAGLGAIALGAWGVAASVSDNGGSSGTTAAAENVQQVVSLISKPTTASIPLQGSGRRIILVVGARGYGVLVLNRLGQAPAGKTYQAWVIRPNVKAPEPAGVFSGGTGVIKLTTPVPPGAVVAITVEREGGAPAPTQTPKLVATRT